MTHEQVWSETALESEHWGRRGANWESRERGGGAGLLTDWLGLESAGRAALAFTFPVDGGHLDLVGGLWLQANDGDLGQVCWMKRGVTLCRERKDTGGSGCSVPVCEVCARRETPTCLD